MKKILFLSLLLITTFSFIASAQLNMTYIGQLEYTQETNDIWGYAAPDSTEYALVGTTTGFSIVSLADPTNPTELFFIPGGTTTWRDIKTWGETAYVVCDNCADGLLVVDLSDLPNSAPFFNVTNIPNVGNLGPAHNIYIDEFGFAYLAGSNINGGGMIYFDVATTPGTPIWAGTGPSTYSHDVYVRDNKMYSSEINAGVFSIYDVTDKDNEIDLGSQATEFNFTHNSWLSDDGNILFTTDEQANAPVGAYDVSDPNDIIELDQFRPYETLGDGVIPHNVHVWNDFLIISYYTDGCILVDGARPENMVEVGNFDTFIPASSGFSGAWGAYPYLPSGLVLVTDIGNGLFVLEPNYVRACYLEGNITDASNGSSVSGANVVIATTNVFETSDAFGAYKTGYAVAGSYDVTVSAPGYESATVQTSLENGEITLLDVALTPLVPFAISGTVTDAVTGAVIPNAQVRLLNDVYDYTAVADADGNFGISNFFSGSYQAYAGKWGYKTSFVDTDLNMNSSTASITLEPGYEDNYVLDLGWTVAGSANTGDWERGESEGIFIDQQGFTFWLTPPNDVDADLGNQCYVTENGSDVFENAVNGGVTRLTSPSIDMSGWFAPTVSIYYWFFNIDVSSNFPADGNDALFFKVDNGIETKTVGSFNPEDLYLPEWVDTSFMLADFIDITDDMKFIVDVSNDDQFEITDMAVDYFRAFDADPNNIRQPIAEGVMLDVFPNPSSTDFYINYEIETAENAFLVVTNILGQQIRKISLENNNGQTNIGATFDAGIYFVQIENAGLKTVATKVVKQ